LVENTLILEKETTITALQGNVGGAIGSGTGTSRQRINVENCVIKAPNSCNVGGIQGITGAYGKGSRGTATMRSPICKNTIIEGKTAVGRYNRLCLC